MKLTDFKPIMKNSIIFYTRDQRRTASFTGKAEKSKSLYSTVCQTCKLTPQAT